MNLVIKSKAYIKIRKKFVAFNEFTGKIRNPNYIEGAIELSVNGVVLLDQSMWDCVDQLWAYLADGLMCVARGEGFMAYFPDQPIEMDFTVHGDGVVVSVSVNDTVKVVVDRFEFISEMKWFAIEFFEGLRGKGERFGVTCDLYLSKLESI